MSKEKLHKVSVGADVNNVPDGWFRIIPATNAEIMDAHPTCGECEHVMVFTDKPVCRHYSSQMRMQRVDPEKDYCRHWEKEQ